MYVLYVHIYACMHIYYMHTHTHTIYISDSKASQGEQNLLLRNPCVNSGTESYLKLQLILALWNHQTRRLEASNKQEVSISPWAEAAV